MTTELEQEFFNTFGIENRFIIHEDDYGEFQTHEKLYPEITAEKFLQMICIVMKYKNTYNFVNGIEDLKEQTLKILISLKDMLSIYAETQQLFNEDDTHKRTMLNIITDNEY